MIGTLKSTEVRTVYDKKVVRITVDVPFKTLLDASIGKKDALDYLQQRVGKHIGLDVTMLEDQDQDVLEHKVQ